MLARSIATDNLGFQFRRRSFWGETISMQRIQRRVNLFFFFSRILRPASYRFDFSSIFLNYCLHAPTGRPFVISLSSPPCFCSSCLDSSPWLVTPPPVHARPFCPGKCVNNLTIRVFLLLDPQLHALFSFRSTFHSVAPPTMSPHLIPASCAGVLFIYGLIPPSAMKPPLT